MRVSHVVQSGASFPPVQLALANVDSARLFCGAHRLRHPPAIYNLSFSKVMSRLADVLNELDAASAFQAYRDPKQYMWDKRLLSELDHLLDALMEHFDDCQSILLCFVESSDDKTFLKALRTFKEATRPYRSHIGQIVDALKHEQRHLASIFFHTPNSFDPGYFVEGPDDGGGIGPDPNIHADGQTAFSFARDLRLHVCGLYFVGLALMPALAVFGKLSLTNKANTDDPKINDQKLETLRRVSLLPLRFFPDELAKPIPMVRGQGLPSSPEFVIEYPATARISGVSGRYTVGYGPGDGFSKTYRIPYMKQPARTRKR